MRSMPARCSGLTWAACSAPTEAQMKPGWPLTSPISRGRAQPSPATTAGPHSGGPLCHLVVLAIQHSGIQLKASLASYGAGAAGHFPGHLGGIAVGHAGNEV